MRRSTLTLALASLPAIASVASAQDRDSLFNRPGLPRDVAREAASLFNATATLRVAGRVEIEAGRVVRGDIAVLNGPVTIAGRVTGRVLAVNSDVILRPSARIDGDLLVIGGEVDGRDEALISGEIRIYRQSLRYRQEGEMIVAERDTQPESEGGDRIWRRWEGRRSNESWSKLQIASAGAYNRVEGLPINLGPQVNRSFGWGSTRLDAYAIVRTGSSFSSSDNDVGHSVRGEVRFGRFQGFALGGRLFNEVEGMEAWQLADLEVGLASFLSHRDYRDYWQRHGGGGSVSLFAWRDISLTGSYTEERWLAREAHDPFTLFRNQVDWRPNPLADEGFMHVSNGTLRIDTRNDDENPWSGWYVLGDYERGVGTLARGTQPGGLVSAFAAPARVDYSRGFIDLRRYNRLSPDAQLNFRIVAGGWLNGDPLPLQRRLSVDGYGAIPGFGFRVPRGGFDIGTCAVDGLFPGRPALCDRIALAQAEYRGDLHFDINPWDWNDEAAPSRESSAHRSHTNHFHRDGSWVIFADAGRGWLVGTPDSTLTYARDKLPALSTFRTDLGLGLDFGGLGFYVAKAISVTAEPARFFIRLRHRF
jgi:hypothetical protein